MNRKLITVEFVVPTVFAVALAIMHSIGAVYLTEMYWAHSIRWKPIVSLAGSR
jgi:hypothetical protein